MREPAVETAHHTDSNVAGKVDGSDFRSGLKELFFIFRQMHFPLKTDQARGIDGDCGVVQYAVVIFGECSGDGTADFFCDTLQKINGTALVQRFGKRLDLARGIKQIAASEQFGENQQIAPAVSQCISDAVEILFRTAPDHRILQETDFHIKNLLIVSCTGINASAFQKKNR